MVKKVILTQPNLQLKGVGLSMCGLLLPQGIKGLSKCRVFFSINIFKPKKLLENVFTMKN